MKNRSMSSIYCETRFSSSFSSFAAADLTITYFLSVKEENIIIFYSANSGSISIFSASCSDEIRTINFI